MFFDTRRIIAFVALLSVLVRTFGTVHGACVSMTNHGARAVASVIANEMVTSESTPADAMDRHCADHATSSDAPKDPAPSPSPHGSSHSTVPCGLMAQCTITALSLSSAIRTVARALVPPPIQAHDVMPGGITVEPAYPPPRA